MLVSPYDEEVRVSLQWRGEDSKPENGSLTNRCERITVEDENDAGLGVEQDERKRIHYNPKWYIVREFLTNRNVNAAAMKNTLASLWRPMKGVTFRDLMPNLVLFQFYHERDVERVIKGGPWTFDRQILLTRQLEETDNAMTVPFMRTEMWVQVHELPPGFRTERIIQLHWGLYWIG